MDQYMPDAKKTWEVFGVLMGFSRNMESGEAISAANSAVDVYTAPDGVNVTGDLVEGGVYVQDGTMLGAVLTGGTSGQKYKARFRAHISETKKLEEDLVFIVKD